MLTHRLLQLTFVATPFAQPLLKFKQNKYFSKVIDWGGSCVLTNLGDVA
jgi:hypothetical protein